MKTFKCLLAALLIGIEGLAAQTPAELKLGLPEIAGWTISENIETFNPENLFDRINGAAPLFIENKFREMTSMEYTKGDDYITIQAYRHESPEDAFGMYTSERSSELKFYPVGGEAQGDDENFYFFAGSVYVKISSSSSTKVGELLVQIAAELAKKIDPNAGYPPVVKAFPANRKVAHTETYITSNYIGHEFLREVYTCTYNDSNGKPFQLFVIDAKTSDGVKEILNKYFGFTKQALDFQEGELTIKDRYNGDIPALWKGQYLIGIFPESGSKVANAGELLNETYSNLSGLANK
jgi:hypothetical protein